jgi:hypothetical protein
MNINLFDKWTKESAYFLGVIAVIGEVDGATLTINASSADRNWLLRVAAIVGLTSLNDDNTISISHKRLTQPLWDMKAKHGSIPEAVPEDLFQHFVRGIFDAGGSVCTQVIFTGKMGMLRKVRDRLVKLHITSDQAVIEAAGSELASLKYSDSDVQELSAFMYKGVGDLCITHKRDAFKLKKEEKTDEPRELHRPGSERSERPRTGGPVLRPRTRQEPDYDSMVW